MHARRVVRWVWLTLCAAPLLAGASALAQGAPSSPGPASALSVARDASRPVAERVDALGRLWFEQSASAPVIDELAPMLDDPALEIRLAAIRTMGHAATALADQCSPGMNAPERAHATAALAARARIERDERARFALYTIASGTGEAVPLPRTSPRLLVVADLEGAGLSARLLAMDDPYSRIESVTVRATPVAGGAPVACSVTEPDDDFERLAVHRYTVTVQCPARVSTGEWRRTVEVRGRIRHRGRFTRIVAVAERAR